MRRVVLLLLLSVAVAWAAPTARVAQFFARGCAASQLATPVCDRVARALADARAQRFAALAGHFGVELAGHSDLKAEAEDAHATLWRLRTLLAEHEAEADGASLDWSAVERQLALEPLADAAFLRQHEAAIVAAARQSDARHDALQRLRAARDARAHVLHALAGVLGEAAEASGLLDDAQAASDAQCGEPAASRGPGTPVRIRFDPSKGHRDVARVHKHVDEQRAAALKHEL